MAQENVELAQAWNEAWNAGHMDAVRELYDPDVVVRPMKDWGEAPSRVPCGRQPLRASGELG